MITAPYPIRLGSSDSVAGPQTCKCSSSLGFILCVAEKLRTSKSRRDDATLYETRIGKAGASRFARHRFTAGAQPGVCRSVCKTQLHMGRCPSRDERAVQLWHADDHERRGCTGEMRPTWRRYSRVAGAAGREIPGP